jgi:hypothetical protein
MQTNPEHQKYDANLCQLQGQALIGDIAGRERTNHNASNKVSHQRGKPQAMSYGPKDEGKDKTCNDSGYEGGMMRHGLPILEVKGGLLAHVDGWS